MPGPRFLASVLLAVAVAGCETPPIEVPFSGTSTVPGCVPDAGPCDPLTSLPAFPGVSEFDVRETGPWRDADVPSERVESAELTSLELSIVSGAEDFRWLDRIAFLVGGDGGEPATVAELVLDGPARASRRLTLVPTGAELAGPLKAGPFLVTTRAEGTLPPVDTAVAVDGVFSIHFGP